VCLCVCVPAAVWFLYMLAYGAFPLQLSQTLYGMLTEVLAPSASYWLLIAVCPLACVLPGFVVRQIARRVALPTSGLHVPVQIPMCRFAVRGVH
jgi:hypothetical protein